MAFSRRLGVIWIAGASWLLAVGCDDSEDQVERLAGAGDAGEAPSAGKSSIAGSQNDGGKAGAGSAGEGGTTSGGNGAAGGGGDAGSGGNSAGQAGAGGEAAGAAGVGGEATGGVGGAGGQGGEGGVAVAATCSFSCANDAACLIGQNGSQKCNLVSHRCEDPTTACTADVDCLISQSAWFFTCADDDGCDPDFEACIDAGGGQGFCATLPDPDCFGGVPRTFPRLGAAGTVEVCASAAPRCMGGACTHGCGDTGCGQGNGNTCSTATGLCECTLGTECTKTGVCGGDAHCQQCKIDNDCAATVALDGRGICVQGTCGCASPTTCVNPGYASATAACQ